LVEDYDEKQLPKVLDFSEHRFVTVERDSVSGATFVRGHKSMRGACSSLSRSVEGCERFIPERVIDLDTEEVHELDVFGFVAPKSVDAVAVMMPRTMLATIDEGLRCCDDSMEEELQPALRVIERALERRTA
jgi:hypothetical protein